MKKNIIKLLVGALAIGSLGACDESEYEIDNLLPEEYAKFLNIRDAGEQSITLYDVGKDDSYTFSVMKTGNNASIPADANIAIMSKEQIGERLGLSENNYEPIPSDLFELSFTDMHFDYEERYKIVTVTFKAAQISAIRELFAKSTGDINHVVALKLDSYECPVNQYNNYIIFSIKDCVLPSYGFASESYMTMGSKSDVTSPIELALEIDNDWNFTADVEVGTDADVAAYNAERGLDAEGEEPYVLLPKDYYTIGTKATFTAGNNTGTIDFSASISKISRDAKYLLPIKLKADGSTTFSIDRGVYYVVVDPYKASEFPRKDWVITGTTEELSGEGADNGHFIHAIDGNKDSFWHTKWSDGPDWSAADGVNIDIELKMDVELEYITKVVLQRRQGDVRADNSKGKFYVSKDGNNWVEVGDFTLVGTDDEQFFELDEANAEKTRGAKYLRIRYTDMPGGLAFLAEIKAYGYTN